MQPANIVEIKSVPCLIINLEVDNYTISRKLLDYIKNALANIGNARLIVIHGSPEIFCSGLNLQEVSQDVLEPALIKEQLLTFKSVLSEICNAPVPVIAKIDGKAFGGGTGIACAADVILMSKSAEFSLPETILGVIPAMIYPYLVRRLSVSKAKELALGLRPITAIEALNIGLVDEVTEDTTKVLEQYVKRISHTSQFACSEFKKLYNEHYGVKDQLYIDDAVKVFVQLLSSDTTKRRIKNFLDGQAPWD